MNSIEIAAEYLSKENKISIQDARIKLQSLWKDIGKRRKMNTNYSLPSPSGISTDITPHQSTASSFLTSLVGGFPTTSSAGNALESTLQAPTEKKRKVDSTPQWCVLNDHYIAVNHGHVILNTKYIAKIQEEHNVFFNIDKCMKEISAGMPYPPLLVPSNSCCGVLRIMHKNIDHTVILQKLQEYIVEWTNNFPSLQPYQVLTFTVSK